MSERVSEANWLVKAGELPEGKQLVIPSISAKDFSSRKEEIHAALRAQYPDRTFYVYWHGIFSIYREKR
jgi:hypothetical protein